MKATLTERGSGKTWTVEAAGSKVITSSSGGKAKEKMLDSPADAAAHAMKEAWSRLKKGFVQLNSHASAGQPVMHLYIGGAYTGFMPLAPVEGTNSVYCASVGRNGDAALYLIDDHAEKLRTCELPDETLLFEMRHAPELDRLLVNASHIICGLSPDTGTLTPYTSDVNVPASVLSAAGTSALWYDGSRLVVRDLTSGLERFAVEAEPEQYGGHTPQLSGALSPDGSMLAYCAAIASVAVVDLNTRQRRFVEEAGEALTAELAFSPDNRFLFALEEYASWGLKCYDLNTMAENPDRSFPGARCFAIHNRRGLLAVGNRRTITVADLASGERLLDFEVEHIVKSCSLAFTDDCLAVYTDYGCLSLYALPEQPAFPSAGEFGRISADRIE